MKLLKIWLSAFGEGGGEGAAAAAPAGTGSNSAAPAQPQSESAPGAQAQGQPETPPAEPTFDELIRGKYRKDYDSRVQEIVTQRLRAKNAELDGMRPIMAILQQRYGVEDGKDAAAAVLQGLQNDDAYWQAAADKAGMTAEQLRRMSLAESRSRELQAMLNAQQTEQRLNETMRQLAEQAEQVKAQYPDFDLNAELAANPRFGQLIQNHIDMLTAYHVCHQQDFLAAAQQQAQQAVADRVRANQSRPAENGTGSGQPVKLENDPSKWSKEKFREVRKRVARGENIRL